MAKAIYTLIIEGLEVSIPQAVLPSCNIRFTISSLKLPRCFNTASGNALLQQRTLGPLALGAKFQYRKRYYPVATLSLLAKKSKRNGFNTASGITQLQPAKPDLEPSKDLIPCFNTASGITQLQQKVFS